MSDPPEYKVYGSPQGGEDAARRSRDPEGDAPGYRVYRSRRGFFSRLRPAGGLEGLRRRRRAPREPGTGPRITPGRVLRWIGAAVGAWILLSILVFFVSAQLAPKVSDRAEEALSPGGNLITGSTVLVLGSDARSEETKEPSATDGPARADSILLVRAALGSVRRLSILRDSYAEIPGSSPQRINAAYAIGGAALMVDTVERFMGNGLEINHVVEVSFEDFPDLIDSLGGIEVTLKNCVRSPPFGGYRVKLKEGTHRLNGKQALRFARVRKNQCAPNEDDRHRAARQQQVVSGIRSSLLRPATFLRLPLVSWEAPRTIRSDMAGPGLIALFTDLVTGGAGKTRVLFPSGVNGDGSLAIDRSARRREVRRLLGKD